jgi:hypothetical protein
MAKDASNPVVTTVCAESISMMLDVYVSSAKTAKTSAVPATNSAPPATTAAIGTADHSKRRSKPATASGA